MEGFTKLYKSILDSSVWDEDVYTRILWVTMLAAVDMEGKVIASRDRLRAKANIPHRQFDKALETLAAPDPESRTPDNEGRRIEKIQGGWLILNHELYLQKGREDERREYKRQWDRKNRPSGSQRAKNAQSDTVRQSPTNPTPEKGKENEDTKEDRNFLSEGARSSGFRFSAEDQVKALELAEEVGKHLSAKGKSNLKAIRNVVFWALEQEPRDRYFAAIVEIAQDCRRGDKPISLFFHRLKKELRYNPRHEKERNAR
jgi:hypothetical protein